MPEEIFDYANVETLRCNNLNCRVDTFERGDGSDNIAEKTGLCPACWSPGSPTEPKDIEL